MNPLDIWTAFRSTRRDLLKEMTRRDIASRYRGSRLGMLWSLLLPLGTLGIYAHVFGAIFRSRWTEPGTAHVPFPIVLFAGLIVFGFFSECVNRAPTLVTSVPNLVKKSVFPLEILPWVTVLTAAAGASVNVAILLLGHWWLGGNVPLTAALFPLVLLPTALFAVGAGWILSSLGVYIRDIAQVIGLATTALLFLSPIFYPRTAIPESARGIAAWNPIAAQVEAMRDVLLWGRMPDPMTYTIAIIAGWLFAWLGLAWFTRSSEGFADVL